MRGSEGGGIDFVTFRKGSFSVCAFYDQNGNGRLDKALLGITKEPVAFTNQAKGRIGPPKFKDTLIELHESNSIELKLNKAK